MACIKDYIKLSIDKAIFSWYRPKTKGADKKSVKKTQYLNDTRCARGVNVLALEDTCNKYPKTAFSSNLPLCFTYICD